MSVHLKPRDRWLHWPAREVACRRHLIAQNARFLVLAAPGRWPNLASRVLKLACDWLGKDWLQEFGHPVLAVAAGCKNPHAIAEFADNLNHGQRRRLRCRPRPGQPRQFDVPGERTFRRLLKVVAAQRLKANQPQALAKARQLLSGNFPPSGPNDR